ncbi:SPOR domain-containing protein [Hymenobacter sp. H14-R3]|uniref:HU domain-containing protein n=1 Tax=Hymenobacter sp. H14-R3 TaxID=3046308 RepID=UPI0024B9EB0D|nr:SPOR domain-containing protein [Hymenobacter sp. H14-R3]MDJ0365884.1 SPOR domain-containing protein [Hymenobacter sp. H14-R3]
MNLSDHLRPLLRDHDCVIIPDFGGLVAESVPAQVHPGGRHLLSPPTRQVAFNQALTRNDGLLVDALREHLGLPAAEAREALRQAVAALHHELQNQQRTELPGIGVFRQQPGRGLQFEYTGTDNLLAAAFGLPELAAHPVAVLDARLAREQQAQLMPRLRSASQGLRLRRLVPATRIGLLAGLAVAGLYMLNLHPENVPAAWQGYLPRWEETARPVVSQQAALAQPSFASAPAVVAEAVAAPVDSEANTSVVAVAANTLAEAVATKAPDVATVAAPQPVAATPTPGQTVDPVDAMLTRSRASLLRPRAKAGKVPAAAAIALADESNVAKPVPMALRKPGTAGTLTTSYAAAATAPRPAAPATLAPLVGAPAPAVHPVVSVKSSKAVTVVALKAVATHTVVPKVGAAHAAAPAPVAAVAVLAPAGAAVPTTIKVRTGRYYLVVAAYSSFARAEEGRRNLAHAGRPAKVICPPAGSRLYRLSAVDFADRPTATVAAAHLRQNPHFDKGLTVLPY